MRNEDFVEILCFCEFRINPLREGMEFGLYTNGAEKSTWWKMETFRQSMRMSHKFTFWKDFNSLQCIRMSYISMAIQIGIYFEIVICLLGIRTHLSDSLKLNVQETEAFPKKVCLSCSTSLNIRTSYISFNCVL